MLKLYSPYNRLRWPSPRRVVSTGMHRWRYTCRGVHGGASEGLDGRRVQRLRRRRRRGRRPRASGVLNRGVVSDGDAGDGGKTRAAEPVSRRSRRRRRRPLLRGGASRRRVSGMPAKVRLGGCCKTPPPPAFARSLVSAAARRERYNAVVYRVFGIYTYYMIIHI